jgi:hypothetical protein
LIQERNRIGLRLRKRTNEQQNKQQAKAEEVAGFHGPLKRGAYSTTRGASYVIHAKRAAPA